MLRKSLKIVGWIAGGLTGLVVLAYAVLVVINWRDQPPSDVAIAFEREHSERAAVADADNAAKFIFEFDEPDYAQSRDPVVKDFAAACGGELRPACVAGFENATPVYEAWVRTEPMLLTRYETLLDRSGWRETIPTAATAPWPSYAPVIDGQKLLLLKSRMLARSGSSDAARALLERDFLFWRNVLASSDATLTKMMASVALDRHLKLGNLVVRGASGGIVPAVWAEPLSDRELSLERSLRGEWIYFAGTMRAEARNPRGVDDALMSMLYEEQDTLNRWADYYKGLIDIVDVPLEQRPQSIGRAAQWSEEHRSANLGFHLYNPVGKILLAIGSPDPGIYAARVTDIEGVRRAVLAAVSLRQTRLPDAQIAAALEQLDIHSPYEDRPFRWDADTREIVFQGLQTGERGVHRIAY